MGRWLPAEFERRDWKGGFWFVRPQVDYLYDGDDLLVQDIIRFEALTAETISAIGRLYAADVAKLGY